MANGDSPHIWLELWSGALSLVSGLGMLVLKLFTKGMDEKHEANTKRFDEIIQAQRDMLATMNNLGKDVAVLKDRAGMTNGKYR